MHHRLCYLYVDGEASDGLDGNDQLNYIIFTNLLFPTFTIPGVAG